MNALQRRKGRWRSALLATSYHASALLGEFVYASESKPDVQKRTLHHDSLKVDKFWLNTHLTPSMVQEPLDLSCPRSNRHGFVPTLMQEPFYLSCFRSNNHGFVPTLKSVWILVLRATAPLE